MSDVLTTEFFGTTLKSPIIIGSGPLSYDAEGIIRAHKAGAGAVVTKTIRSDACKNPYPHMVRNSPTSLINAEKWADIPGKQWIDLEIPKAVEAGAVVIGSVGHSSGQIEEWIKPLEQAGVAAIEVVTYQEELILPMAKTARKLTDIPVLVKLSPNWNNPVEIAQQAIAMGVDGITAMDSVGPVLRIDIKSRRPMVGSENGFGWMTGSSIKPIVLRYIAELAAKIGKPIIGIGGVANEEDVVEFLMAGSSAVGVCTAPILKGIEYVNTLNRKTGKLLAQLGYKSIKEVSGTALPFLPLAEILEKFTFVYDETLCTECGMCLKVCPYKARTMDGKDMHLDTDLCRYCGLCVTVCPTAALTQDPA